VFVDFRRKKIIIVDDDITNLIISKEALTERFDVLTVPSGEICFRHWIFLYPI